MTSKDDRLTKALIKEYELLASSPREVYNCYKERADNPDKYRFDYEIDEHTDKALWATGEPLTMLAIAKYGSNEEIAKDILKGDNKALRVAMLQNWSGSGTFSSFPADIFENDAELANFLNTCPDDDFYSLFINPEISDSFTRDFFEGKKFWNELSVERQQFSVQAFSENPRASKPYDDSFMDGYADYSYHAVFSACWELCAKVPVTKKWAISMYRITQVLLPQGSPFKDDEIMAVIARWFPPKEGEEESKYDSEERYKESGHLSIWQDIRKSLTQFILNSSKFGNLAENSDIAIRCGYYRYGRFYTDEMEAAFQRDGEAAWQSMAYNLNLWSSKDRRETLRKIAWAADDLDGRSNLDNANQFNALLERNQEKYPQMFRDEEIEVGGMEDDEGDLPATKGYVYQMTDILASYVLANKAKLEAQEKKLKIITWVVGITLGFVLLKFA